MTMQTESATSRAGAQLLLLMLAGAACQSFPAGEIGDPGHPRDESPLRPPDFSAPPPSRSGPLPAVKLPQFPTAVATAPPPAISGGTLRVLADGKTALAADPDRDVVWVVDLAAAQVTAQVALLPGDQPGRSAQDAAGRVHVVLRGGGAILTLDPASGMVLGRRAVCDAPRGIAADATGARLFVACAGGELVTLDAAPVGAVIATAHLDRDLRDVIVDGDRLYVSTFRQAELLAVDVAGGGSVRLRHAPPPALNLFRRQGAGRGGPAATRFVARVAWRTVAAPGGGALMLHQRDFTGDIAIRPGPGQTGGYGGSGPRCDSIVQTAVTRFSPNTTTSTTTPSPAIALSVLTVDVAVSPDGRTLAMVSPADAHIVALGSAVTTASIDTVVTDPDDDGCVVPVDPLISILEQLGQLSAAPLPRPDPLIVHWTPFQGTGAVRSRVAAELTAVAFTGAGDVVVQSREPAALLIPARRVSIVLPGPSRADTGHAVFHANAGSDIACAACHPEGHEDGHVWTFSDLGARRTQSLRGGVTGTLPLHWDGDMASVAQIMKDVFTERMGGPVLQPAEDTAVTRFIDAIPTLAAPPPADLAAWERGQGLFAGAGGCTTCHAGARTTDNRTVDVGTGRAFQVPSLAGVGWRTPLMHDGCAVNASARFDVACGGDRHGNTAALSDAQRADLTVYLEAL